MKHTFADAVKAAEMMVDMGDETPMGNLIDLIWAAMQAENKEEENAA